MIRSMTKMMEVDQHVDHANRLESNHVVVHHVDWLNFLGSQDVVDKNCPMNVDQQAYDNYHGHPKQQHLVEMIQVEVHYCDHVDVDYRLWNLNKFGMKMAVVVDTAMVIHCNCQIQVFV